MRFIEEEVGCLWTRGLELILLSLCSGVRCPSGHEGRGNRGCPGHRVWHIVNCQNM